MQINKIQYKKGYGNPYLIGIAIIIVIAIYGGFTATTINLDIEDVESCSSDPSGDYLICSFDSSKRSVDSAVMKFNIVTLGKRYYDSFIPIFSKNYPEYSDFFNKNKQCEDSSSKPLIKANVKSDLKEISQYFELREITTTTDRRACGSEAYRVDVSSFIRDKFSPQVVILEGAYTEGRSNADLASASEPFKVIGECTSNGNYIDCKIDDLFKYNTARIDSVKLYVKKGGYDINKFCPVYGAEKCDGNEVVVCKGNQYDSLGKIDGKCGYTAPKKTPEVTIQPVKDDVTTEDPENDETVNSDNSDVSEDKNIFEKIIDWFRRFFS